MKPILIVALLSSCALGETPSAARIMRQVAENQDRAEAARVRFVYDQNILVRLKRANGKLAREEIRDYTVTPGARGGTRTLVRISGKIHEGNSEIPYSDPKFRRKNIDFDGEIVESMADHAMRVDQNDAADVEWFPLTARRQKNYAFQLEGEERYRGYYVYRISFHETGEDACWKGEALIERKDLQPVEVTTHMFCKIPKWVTIAFGMNFHNIGAKILYQRFDDNVWFPTSYGGEFKVRALYLYARTISFGAKNSGFRKVDVQTSIAFDGPEQPER